MATSDSTELTRCALEQVCSGSDPSAAVGVYSQDFSRPRKRGDGEIVEDWAASDNLQLIRRLGPWRLLLLGVAWLRRLAISPPAT